MSFIVCICEINDPDSILVREYRSDMDALDAARDELCYEFDYVSDVYCNFWNIDKLELIQKIEENGWWFIKGKEQEGH